MQKCKPRETLNSFIPVCEKTELGSRGDPIDHHEASEIEKLKLGTVFLLIPLKVILLKNTSSGKDGGDEVVKRFQCQSMVLTGERALFFLSCKNEGIKKRDYSNFGLRAR